MCCLAIHAICIGTGLVTGTLFVFPKNPIDNILRVSLEAAVPVHQ